jgi:GT2 family glycosyltransferase
VKIYVVIPVFNRKALTRTCLLSLQEQDNKDFEVVVVDDASTDGTSEMIRKEFPEIVLLNGDGDLWWVGSINLGIKHVLDICQPEDYILTLNDDLVVRQNYISTLFKATEAKPGAIIGSVETTSDESNIIKNGGYYVNWVTAKNKVLNQGKNLEDFPPDFMLPIPKLTGRGTLFPTKVFRDVGLYDNVHFKQCGDMELPAKAHLKYGYDLYINYESVVISHVGKKDNINTRSYYLLTHAKEYFFGIKSHFNIRDHYWFAYNIAPNRFWFVRFVTLEFLRNVYHFVSRIKFPSSIGFCG